MVSSSVIVLALMSFVTATPHEYGDKTGAAAKAEASAVAGAFGGLPVIPLHIPSGSGFSGSFSKSSSSSFASSSSSASSSSYRFSANNGISGGGCLSGTCKSGEGSIPSSFSGSPNTQIMHHSSESSAVAAAKTSAEAATYGIYGANNAPCPQGNCKELSGSTNCGTGQCDRSSDKSSSDGSSNGIQATNSENQQKCLSGNCIPISKQQPDRTSNPDDFEVNFSRDTKINNPNGYTENNSQLNNGKVSPTLLSGKNSPKCNSPSCDTFLALSPPDNVQSFNSQKPAAHFVTPNIRPTCTTHNCDTDSTVPNENNGKPSSYNVPILGSNPSYQQKNPSMAPLSNFPPQPQFGANCGSTGCTSNNVQSNTDYVELKTPNYSHLNYPSNSVSFGVPTQTPTNIPFPCNTLNCGNFPIPSQSINSGWSNAAKPNLITTPTNQNVPTYNNMGGPGFLNMVQPNNFGNHNLPPYSQGFGGPKRPLNSAIYPGVTGTAKPNLITISDKQNAPIYTNGFGGPPGPVNAAIPAGSLTAKPISYGPSTESNLPLYTGGFGGPQGSVTAPGPAGIFTTLKPNLNIKPNEQIYISGFGGHAGAFDTASTLQHNTHVNTNSQITSPTIAPNNFVQNNVNPSGHATSTVPKVDEKEKLPPYTGGFGGPPGMLKPNEYNIPSKLASPIPSIPCFRPDCSKKPVSNENYNSAGASATAMANADAVAYTGGFGAPPGLLEPGQSKNVNGDSDSNNDNKSNQVNNQANSQENSGNKKTAQDDYTALNDYIKQTNIADGNSAGSQNNAAESSPIGNENVQNNSDKKKAFNDYIQPENNADASAGSQTNVGGSPYAVNKNKHPSSDENKMLNDYFAQANIANAAASAGAQTDASGASHSVNKNKHDNYNENKMLNDYFAQANIANAAVSAGAQTDAGGASHSVNKNKHDNSNENKMLNDYFAQANIANAAASAGAQVNVADQDNFIPLTGLNSYPNSGCSSNCRSNSNGGVISGASASAQSVSNAGSWAAGQSFVSGAATAHAVAGASIKGGYGRR